jgi:hypothetical protein
LHHGPPSGITPPQIPTLHTPEQQSAGDAHQAPFGLHGPASGCHGTQVPAQATEQHS